MNTTLAQFPPGQYGMVDSLQLPEDSFRRVAAFGLTPGCRFLVKRVAPLGGPLLLEVGATRFLMRRALAGRILVRAAA